MSAIILGSDSKKLGSNSRKLLRRDNFTAESRADFNLDKSLLQGIISGLESDNADVVLQKVSGLHAADIAMILESIKAHEREKFIRIIVDLISPELLLPIGQHIKAEMVDILGHKRVGELLACMTNEDVVDFLEYFSFEEQLHILKKIPPEHRKKIKIALRYPKRSAGRIMDIDYIVVTEEFLVSETIEYIRERCSQLPAKLYDIFVVNAECSIIGTVSLVSLLKSNPELSIKSIADDNFIAIKALDKRKDVAYVFNKYDLDSAPVVDMDGKLVGVITVDSVKYITDQENEEELLKMGGVLNDLDEGFLSTAKIRFVWLFVNLVTAALASWVISFFEHEIHMITALAVLMPIAVSMGCNAGTQTITVIIRAIATKHLNHNNFPSYFNREIGMAILNSLVLCFLCVLSVLLFYRKLGLALVFGAAIVITMLTGALSGVVSPVIMKRLNTDPAITAVVFLTTVTEVVAFLSFLGLAKFFLL